MCTIVLLIMSFSICSYAMITAGRFTCHMYVYIYQAVVYANYYAITYYVFTSKHQDDVQMSRACKATTFGRQTHTIQRCIVV